MDQIKIQINKDDELPVVAAKVFSADAEEVVLIIPKFSKLAESADNFRFLKKGLSGSNKVLLVESVDDKAVKAAEQAKISASNPFFGNEQPVEQESVDQENVGDNVFNEAEKELERTFAPEKLGGATFVSARRLVGIAAAAILLSSGFWAGAEFLPQAEIKITTKKYNWQFKDKVVIDKNATAADLKNLKIPGQVFSQKKNGQLTFSATGKKIIQQKAQGKIVIYNAYSSSPQSLVASTRFQTSDGKIFRLDKAVIVPGAKIVDGKIVPLSLEADITADKSGADYNVGPIAKLTIPGFKNSPKFAGFYGEIKNSLQGGYSGERAYPTDEDIARSKGRGAEALKDSLTMEIGSRIPEDFKIVSGAGSFKITKEKVNTDTDSEGKFSVFTEVELSMMGFREKDLLAALEGKAKEHFGEDFNVKSHNLKYEPAEKDIEKGSVALAVDFNAVVSKPIDIKNLKQKFAGLSENDLRASIFSLTGMENAQISLWPFWVGAVPDNIGKIKIDID